MKILIVDDDPYRLTSLKEYLIAAQSLTTEEVYSADNVEDAEELLIRFHFDVLILDVVLPKNRDSHSRADSKHGLDFLTTINRKTNIKKPSKIIGITAHLDDMGRFQKSFLKFCLVVIEANRKSIGWKKALSEYVGYDHLARAHREIDSQSLNVVTIHGIRTFGHWQARLRELVHTQLMPVPFHSYKYGYTSFLALFLKGSHTKQINLLATRLTRLFDENVGSNFIIFCHSFGTYLAIETLRKLSCERTHIPVSTVVLSGSVLLNGIDLTFLSERSVRIVNDCADSDYVLWLSEAFVPHLGMAGKTGIYGFENKLLINRFFRGGHSSYFEGDDFMKNYWLPLLNISEEPKSYDLREISAMEYDFFEGVVVLLGGGKAALVRGVGRLKMFFGLSTRTRR